MPGFWADASKGSRPKVGDWLPYCIDFWCVRPAELLAVGWSLGGGDVFAR